VKLHAPEPAAGVVSAVCQYNSTRKHGLAAEHLLSASCHMADQGSALPWASGAAAAAAEADADVENLPGLPLDQVGLAIGARIEVGPCS
jgi:hypothetical protein